MSKLADKIAKAALVVGGKLKADKKNLEQHYDYISADKILSEVGQALFSQGLAVIPEIQEFHITPFDRGNGKNPRLDADVKFVIHITDGEESRDMPWFGMGSDYSTPDKALYKAITSGHKYFLMKLLCIGEGNEDSEHEDEESNGGKPIVRQPAPRPTTTTHAPPEPPVAVTFAAESGAQVSEQAAPVSGVSLEEARHVIIKTSAGEKFLGELDREHLEAVVAKSKNAEAVFAAKMLLEND